MVPLRAGRYAVTSEFRSDDWDKYKMDLRQPHVVLEPPEKEIAVVDAALTALRQAGILAHTQYDRAKFLAHRQAVRELFEIPWTGITPRMQRLLYAINAITQPADKLPRGAIVLAHNSVNCAKALGEYLAHVRDGNCFRASVNVIKDGEGLEVSFK